MENCNDRRKHSSSFWAWFFIIVGGLLLFNRLGYIPSIGNMFGEMGNFIGRSFHFMAKIGWPIFLIAAGILLLAGRRFIGLLILFLILLFVLPHFIIPGLLLIILFPVILMIAGIVLLIKLL